MRHRAPCPRVYSPFQTHAGMDGVGFVGLEACVAAIGRSERFALPAAAPIGSHGCNAHTVHTPGLGQDMSQDKDDAGKTLQKKKQCTPKL